MPAARHSQRAAASKANRSEYSKLSPEISIHASIVFEFGKWCSGLMFCAKEYTMLGKIEDRFSKDSISSTLISLCGRACPCVDARLSGSSLSRSRPVPDYAAEVPQRQPCDSSDKGVKNQTCEEVYHPAQANPSSSPNFTAKFDAPSRSRSGLFTISGLYQVQALLQVI